jgi:hypothetical protein
MILLAYIYGIIDIIKVKAGVKEPAKSMGKRSNIPLSTFKLVVVLRR